MPVADEVMRYAVQLARTSRPSGANPPDFVKQYEGRGQTVKLEASAKQAVQVKVIPAE